VNWSAYQTRVNALLFSAARHGDLISFHACNIYGVWPTGRSYEARSDRPDAGLS